MRSGISFTLPASVRLRLEALVADRNTPEKHVWRARIVLLSADGLGTHAIMREAGVSKTAVWRWQERFAQEGIEGLLWDRTRPARIPPLGPEVAARVVALTQGEPPGETTHWTAAAMAQAASISVSSVQRISARRALTIRSEAQHEALRVGRAREQTVDFAAKYAWRAGVEGTIAHGVRSSRLRRTPFRSGEDAARSPDDGRGDEPPPVIAMSDGRTEGAGAGATRRLRAAASLTP